MYMCIRGVDFSLILRFVDLILDLFYSVFFLFLLDLYYYHIQFVSHVELINILSSLSSSGRQTEEGKYRIETEEDVCYL
jgi:hypothetical protein